VYDKVVAESSSIFRIVFRTTCRGCGSGEPTQYQKTLLYPKVKLLMRRHAWRRRAAG
jgi:hypothetical protein